MRKWLNDWVIAACFAAVVAFVLPFQTYLSNADLYAFSLGRVIFELAVLFVGFGLIAFLLLFFAGRFLGGVLQAVFVAATVGVYLECGILSLGLPELNGGPVALLADKGRCLLDASIWVGILVLLVVTVRWTRPWLHWVAVAILLLSVASLFDVHKAALTGADRKDPGFVNQMTVVANVKYSPVRNVLVFILDSMPGQIVFDVATKYKPEVWSKLSGFRGYPRNVGMHEVTKRGVPGLVTGHYYDPDEMPEHDYPMTMYGTNSYITLARDLGWNVSFSPDVFPYGYTNLPIRHQVAREEPQRARDAIGSLRLSKEAPFLSFFNTVAFRYAPFFFKGPLLYSCIRHSVTLRHASDGFWGEKSVFGQLASSPIGEGDRPFVGTFHTWGAHPPWNRPFEEVALDLLGQLGELMEVYRARGIYDNSLIIVTSDHGMDLVPPLNGYPSSASAFLLVKPVGAKEPFVISDIPTSHSRVAPLVKASLASPLSLDACEAILRDEKQLYRSIVHEGGRTFFRDWSAK